MLRPAEVDNYTQHIGFVRLQNKTSDRAAIADFEGLLVALLLT